MARLQETTLLGERPSVTFAQITETGVIPNVKVIGLESKNGRQYKIEALREGARHYEGVKVFLNHPKRSEVNEDRDFRTWVGTLEGVRDRADGLYAERLRLRKHGPYFKEIAEAATDFWKDFGLSHVADCDSRHDPKTGLEVIESVNEVFSVDIVDAPGANANLYESEGRMATKAAGKIKKLTLGAILEAAKGSTADTVSRKVLLEMVDTGLAQTNTEIPVEDGAAVDEQINEALRQVIADKMKSADNASLKKIIKALGMTDSISDMIGGGTTPDPANPPAEPAKLEALQKQLDQLAAKNLLLESGREPLPIWLETIAGLPEAKREAFVKTLPTKVGGGPNRGARPATSPPVRESAGSGADYSDLDDDGEESVEELQKRFESRATETEKRITESKGRPLRSLLNI